MEERKGEGKNTFSVQRSTESRGTQMAKKEKVEKSKPPAGVKRPYRWKTRGSGVRSE